MLSFFVNYFLNVYLFLYRVLLNGNEFNYLFVSGRGWRKRENEKNNIFFLIVWCRIFML